MLFRSLNLWVFGSISTFVLTFALSGCFVEILVNLWIFGFGLTFALSTFALTCSRRPASWSRSILMCKRTGGLVAARWAVRARGALRALQGAVQGPAVQGAVRV